MTPTNDRTRHSRGYPRYSPPITSFPQPSTSFPRRRESGALRPTTRAIRPLSGELDSPNAAVAIELPSGDPRDIILWKIDSHKTLVVE